ncbi:Ferredoxin-3 [Hibiscus syriacus]|uniref:Ferredoxin n=2 Tax=Hibiscus syriacus TaxID=106335 RepID=A0A6A2XTS0_HIBSY|nr:ferredoxin, root R-B2-like isoform X2 [Hibiscus syriacus]KAE8678888.1 Ferredoxin-3 [Hibiscus syriacus]
MATVSLSSPSIVKAAIPNQFTSSMVKAPRYVGSVKTISKSFGLGCSSNHRMTMAMYKIKLVGPKGEVNEFKATEAEYILEAAEAAGVELPYCCRAGACSICTAKVVSGTVHQPDAIYLEDDQIKEGYMLTCVSKPTSDCEIHTHKELDLYSPSK